MVFLFFMKKNVGVIASHEKIIKYWRWIDCTKGQMVTIVHLNIVLRLHIKISFNHKSAKIVWIYMVTMKKFINPFKIQIHGDTNKIPRKSLALKAHHNLRLNLQNLSIVTPCNKSWNVEIDGRIKQSQEVLESPYLLSTFSWWKGIPWIIIFLVLWPIFSLAPTNNQVFIYWNLMC